METRLVRSAVTGRKIPLLVMLGLAVAAAATYPLWNEPVGRLIGRESRSESSAEGNDDDHAGHDHAGHDHAEHDHPGHSDDASIELSATALRNIGYEPFEVGLGSFDRSITVPAMVVERPGRSQLRITAPMSGVVTKIEPIHGAAIEPGAALFEIRLTHEELVTAQSALLRTVESLDVIRREIDRLTSVGEGVVAGRRIIEQEYERQRLEASLRAESQALLLHGLTVEQVDGIVNDRQLISTIAVTAPIVDHDDEACEDPHLYHVQDLPVRLGEHVEIGQTLCVLADHCELFIEGRAFEDDAQRLREASRNGWRASAAVVVGDGTTDVIEGLELLYLDDQVDTDSRIFRFYLRLLNQVMLDRNDALGYRFLDWRFKPGQRLELHVPVERWESRLVLPVDAVIEEGVEAYVYRRNGDHFDRISVQVEYRDQRSCVIANDGTLFPGDVVAGRGAYQMHLALKNKSGGGVDPHAGHNH